MKGKYDPAFQKPVLLVHAFMTEKRCMVSQPTHSTLVLSFLSISVFFWPNQGKMPMNFNIPGLNLQHGTWLYDNVVLPWCLKRY